MHKMRERDPLGRYIITDPVPRFWERVLKSDGCWEWTGIKHYKGYGEFTPLGHRKVKAHRYSYILHYGPISDEIQVLHKCDNPPCVRPDHLFLGTNLDNKIDSMQKGRHAKHERNGSAKVTMDQVEEIRRTYSGGTVTQTSLARLYGLSTREMCAIVRFETWR